MTKSSSKEEFIKKAINIHGNTYCYDNVLYKNNRIPVQIYCNIHGLFYQRPDNHLSGKGCQECSGNKKITIKQFLVRANEVHNNYYIYDKVELKSTHSKVIIECVKHGEFLQTPNKHIYSKNGCPRCVGMNTNNSFFIEKALLIHGSRYDYSLIDYKNSVTKIKIICRTHGEFYQNPSKHLNGCGCPKCNINSSNKELAWLKSLDNYNDIIRSYTIRVNNKRIFFADGFDSKTNTIYEFYGDFWHGNPEIYPADKINKVIDLSFGELYKKTLDKENDIKKLGYNIVSIWENDWNKIIKGVK